MGRQEREILEPIKRHAHSFRTGQISFSQYLANLKEEITFGNKQDLPIIRQGIDAEDNANLAYIADAGGSKSIYQHKIAELDILFPKSAQRVTPLAVLHMEGRAHLGVK